MKIKSLMISNPITIEADASIEEAINLMKENAIRHLPVVSRGQTTLEGFVTLADLKLGLIPSLVAGVSLTDLIIQSPITVHPDDEIETAAELIYIHKISGLPVVKNSQLVGIITETDILRTFIDMMGILTASSRIDVAIKEDPEDFKRALQIIHDNGGDIINVGMTARKKDQRIYYFRLMSCKTEVLKSALERHGFKVIEAID